MGFSTGRRPLWDRVANNLQEWYSEAVGWTGEKARIGVKKMDMVGIQHNIKRSMTHLGGRVYDLIQNHEDILSDAQVRTMVSALQKLEDELAGREREIEALRTRRGADEDEAAADAVASHSAPGLQTPGDPAEDDVHRPGGGA